MRANVRNRYLPGVPCWIDTEQPDPEAAAAFYGGLFGWTFEEQASGYRVARLDGRDVAGIAAGGTPAAWNTYVAVESADVAAARVHAGGGRILAGPRDLPGGRFAAFADPQGAPFRVWEAGEHEGAELVNAPNSWNWSDLSTSEGERAAEFYAAVFGWEVGDVGMGIMWRLPGYGDFLAERDPSLRERHAEPGVPAGFSDAVGWLLPADDGEPQRWNVTFSVDDADAAARRAEALGGTVVTPPYDAGPVRAAVVRDPAGAAFTISRYAP